MRLRTGHGCALCHIAATIDDLDASSTSNLSEWLPVSAGSHYLQAFQTWSNNETDAVNVDEEGWQLNFTFFGVFTRFSHITGQANPITVVLEDLHWADGGSCELLKT